MTELKPCTHEKFIAGHWEESPYYDPREDDVEDSMEWVPEHYAPTTVDVDIHHYKCTQCGKVMSY